jgi:phage-related protein
MRTNFNAAIVANPDKGIKLQTVPKVQVAQFGDGYSQRSAIGINNTSETWSVTWKNRPSKECDNIIGFLEGLKGQHAFDWYPPETDVSGEADTAAALNLSAATTTNVLIDYDKHWTDLYLGARVEVVDEGGANLLNTTEVIDIDYSYATSINLEPALILRDEYLGGAHGYFYYLYPVNKYLCKKWTSQIVQTGVKTVSAEFTRVYEL